MGQRGIPIWLTWLLWPLMLLLGAGAWAGDLDQAEIARRFPPPL